MVKSEDFLPAASGLDGIEWTEDTPKLILSYGDAAAERHSALTGAFLIAAVSIEEIQRRRMGFLQPVIS